MKLAMPFFRTFLPLFFVILAAGFYIDRQKKENAFEITVKEQERQLLLKHELILHFFDPLIFDIYYLTHEKSIKRYIEDSSHRKEVAEELRLFAHTRKAYNQLSIIGNNGHERAKVAYRHDSAYVIADRLLHDRNSDIYFAESMKLQPGEIYISSLALNVESDNVAMPYTPVLCTGMGLFDEQGNRKGVLIFNYMMKEFLGQLDHYYTTEDAKCSLLNEQGYWLQGPKSFVTFGFMFTDSRKNRRFDLEFQGAWKMIKINGNGYAKNQNGLFVYRTIHLFQSLQHSSLVKGNKLVIPGHSDWILVSQIEPEILHQKLYRHRNLLWGLVALMIVISGVIAYIVASNYTKEVRRREEILHINQKLTEHEEVLEERAQELTGKNKELEQFAYITSHDLQEPLRMISSFLQLLEKRSKDQLDATSLQYIHFAVDGAERMKELIHDLLRYSRIGFNQAETVETDMNAVLQRVLMILEEPIRKNGAHIIRHRLPVVIANPIQMEQLLLNLVENALKYRSGDQPVIEIGCRDEEDKWVFFVKDNGIGIDPRFFDKIFVIFQRLHNRTEYPGTGIGLAICKKIVEQHGGELWVESFLGGGSTFSFSIKKHDHA